MENACRQGNKHAPRQDAVESLAQTAGLPPGSALGIESLHNHASHLPRQSKLEEEGGGKLVIQMITSIARVYKDCTCTKTTTGENSGAPLWRKSLEREVNTFLK